MNAGHLITCNHYGHQITSAKAQNMAKRLRVLHQEDVRRKIQCSQLINKLENHVLNDTEMSSTQVQAAKYLLDKAVGNMAPHTEQQQDPGNKADEILKAIADRLPE